MSGFISQFQMSIRFLPKAFVLAPLAFLIVFLGEGLQHFYEYQTGMFQSLTDFENSMKSRTRLSFGLVKALSLVIGSIWVCFALNRKHSTYSAKMFRKQLVRRLWDPRDLDVEGFIIMFMMLAPLIYVHFKLNYLAMGHDLVIPILVLDSLLIAALAIVMGTVIWVDIAKQHLSDEGLALVPN